MGSLTGKVAIVTGGGRGIGRSHALALAREGVAVIVNDSGVAHFDGEGERTLAPAEAVVSEIEAAGGRAVADGHDISTWTNASAVIDCAIEAFGRLDILVNNAAIARGKPIQDLSEDDWHHSIAVNLTGTVATSYFAAAYWQKQGPETGRTIINTSSGVVLPPVAGGPPYVVSKAAVATFSMTAALELAHLGVRVNAIAPVARTRISTVMAPDMMKPVEHGFDHVAPENVSAVLLFLASPECTLTGQLVGSIGDQLFLCDSWRVIHHFSNNQQAWMNESLRNALNDVPAQRDIVGMGYDSILVDRFPTDAAIVALEQSAKAA